ncbi:MAG: hypothetical protein WBA97_32490 [Actinophytocola sp.]|uniref:hypothetical protein n=1 Tax=Actinophytocola sp. TaxID=1872138 RepID=UPI003C720FC5
MSTAAAGILFSAAGASADVSVEACTGTSNQSFSPALTQTAQSVNFSAASSYTCTINGSSAVASFGTTATLSCLNVLAGLPPSDRTLTWTGGVGSATSTLHFTGWQTSATLSTAQGIVTAGRYAGDMVVLVFEAVAVNGSGIPLLCQAGLGTISSSITEDVLAIVGT